MTKKGMNLRYKSRKRQRNKVKFTSNEDKAKSTIISIVSIVGFLALFYLLALGLEKLGVFDEGYNKPIRNTEISYTDILIGETFNREEKEYLVLFDTFGDKTNDVYVEYMFNKYEKLGTYKVDMSILPNSKYLSDEVNKKPKTVSDLKINDITLIRIKNGVVAEYLTGSEEISKYLEK